MLKSISKTTKRFKFNNAVLSKDFIILYFTEKALKYFYFIVIKMKTNI